MNKLLYILSLFILLNNTGICQQIDSLSKLKTGGENIYLHYDRDTYLVGDTLWFKAYLVNKNGLAGSSKSFYLELFNDNGKLLNRVTAPIFESTASGSIVLTTDSVTNHIYCRAYTMASLQEDKDLIYTHRLNILNLKQRQQISSNHLVTGRFLPESGNWINGTPSLISYLFTDENGMPVNVAGQIKSGGKTITSFQATHNGMGSFTILPESGSEYTAVWKTADSVEHSTNLPLPKPRGISMHISDITEGKKFFISGSKQVDDADKNLLLVATISNTVVYQAKADLSVMEANKGTIPIGGLPSGILSITIFNHDHKPIIERITFVNNQNYTFNADVKQTATSKQRRGLNKLLLNISDTLRSNLSIAVTDADIEAKDVYRDNIISHLLLTGELRAKIIDPYYYFINKSDSVTRALDLLMLTHGWRRYNWENTKEVPLVDHNFLSLQGKIANGGSIDGTVSVIIQTPDSSNTLLPLNINKDGSFFKDGLIFYGDARLFFKFSSKNVKSNQVKLTGNNGLIDAIAPPSFDPNATISAPKQQDTFPALKKYKAYTNLKGIKALNEIIVKAKPITEDERLDNTYTSGVFSGGIYKSINIGNDPKAINYVSIFQYLLGKLAGVKIDNSTSLYPAVSWRDIPVTFFLNNARSTTYDIRSIAMTEFDYMKIYDPAMGGIFGAYGGVIAVYTKKGKGFNFNSNNDQSLSLKGYTPVKEFYSPDYATIVNTDKPDLRTTLYWNPNIILDKSNPQFNFQFYNNDVAKNFRITIEGVNSAGKLVHIEKEF